MAETASANLPLIQEELLPFRREYVERGYSKEPTGSQFPNLTAYRIARAYMGCWCVLQGIVGLSIFPDANHCGY